jgi:hypothetical protein
MNDSPTLTRYQELWELVAQANEQILELQARCLHEGAVKDPKKWYVINTDLHDPLSTDPPPPELERVAYECLDCGKRWTKRP